VEILGKCHSEERHGMILNYYARFDAGRYGLGREIRGEVCHPFWTLVELASAFQTPDCISS
jgi:hypothetical protein